MGALQRFDALDANHVHMPDSSCPLYADVIKRLNEYNSHQTCDAGSGSPAVTSERKSNDVNVPLRITVSLFFFCSMLALPKFLLANWQVSSMTFLDRMFL